MRRACRSSSTGCGIRNLSIGERSVDLLLQRYHNNVGIEVARKDRATSRCGS